MTPAIRVEALSKRYTIGLRGAPRTMREALSATLSRARHLFVAPRAANGADNDGEFWALKEISFEVMPGEVMGIIGRNGAGKSTLLKILSRITEPTSGRVDLHGRVGSLLEVGTGFHPELTGRENIFLNGAILGMKRAEIARRFDEIVDFSGVEKFIDTPVKRYSSGMYVRLAFAVAAHLQPEILLVDEVLAVGDAEFQKKCLGKMGDVARQGRTVLFVSHNMAAIESLCGKCLLLKDGTLVANDIARRAIAQYFASHSRPDEKQKSLQSHPGRRKGCEQLMTSVSLCAGADPSVPGVLAGGALSVSVSFVTGRQPLRPVLGVVVKSQFGAPLFGVNNLWVGGYEFSDPVTAGTITCTFERLPLVPGTYHLDLHLHNGVMTLDTIEDAISFEVLPADFFGTGHLPNAAAGPILVGATFRLDDATPASNVTPHEPHVWPAV